LKLTADQLIQTGFKQRRSTLPKIAYNFLVKINANDWEIFGATRGRDTAEVP
jgi:hypothetical protein